MEQNPIQQAFQAYEEGEDISAYIGRAGVMKEPGKPSEENTELVHASIILVYNKLKEPEKVEAMIRETVQEGRFKGGINFGVDSRTGEYWLETKSRKQFIAFGGNEVDARRYPDWYFKGAGDPKEVAEFSAVLEKIGWFLLSLVCKEKTYLIVYDRGGNFLQDSEGLTKPIFALDGMV